MFSAVWIVVANSWQQTPAGFHIVGEGLRARAEITDFWAMVFNPSAMHRLGHVLLGCFIQGAFFAMSVSAWYVLKGRHRSVARKGFDIALASAALSSIAILASGHAQAVKVSETQPAKLAAFEGHFKSSEGGTTLYLWGIPSEERQSVELGLGVPGLLSLLVHNDSERPVTALDSFPRDEWPPVQIPFQTYHLMVALGMFFIGVTWLAVFLRWRQKLYDQRWLMGVFVGAVVAPVLANQAGWVAAEVGRQPWVVYGLLKTSDAVSRSVAAEQVAVSMVLFSLVYIGLLGLWLFVLNSKIQHGPQPASGASSGLPLIETASLRPAHAETRVADPSHLDDSDQTPPSKEE
jgi:cytochrome d ubiquinol oxidase subunit I